MSLPKKESTQEELLEMALSGFDPVVRSMYEEAFAGRPMIVRGTCPPTHQYWKAE